MPISPSRILYKDENFLIVNKLSKELTVQGKGKLQKLPLFDLLKQEYPELQVLQRLDFETSGVVVFARNAEVHKAVIDSDFDGWTKTYTALVSGRIGRPKGSIKAKLEARNGKGKVDAETRYEVVTRYTASTLIEAEILTGRHHQIRKHFAHIGHPLVCDDVYGNPKYNRVFTREFGYRDFFLHASCVVFTCPLTGKKIDVRADVPRVFRSVLKKLPQ